MNIARTTSVAAMMTVAVLVGGCGGPMERDELERGIASLGAIAEEGRLVARDVALDRTKTTFVRVHARDLGDEADHEAEKLADAEGRGAVAEVKAQAVELAQDIADALGDLQVRAGDRATGAEVAGRLTRLAGTAQDLEARL